MKKKSHFSSASSGRMPTKYYKDGKKMMLFARRRFEKGYKKQYGR